MQAGLSTGKAAGCAEQKISLANITRKHPFFRIWQLLIRRLSKGRQETKAARSSPSPSPGCTEVVYGEGVLGGGIVQEPVQHLGHLSRAHALQRPPPLPADQVLQERLHAISMHVVPWYRNMRHAGS